MMPTGSPCGRISTWDRRSTFSNTAAPLSVRVLIVFFLPRRSRNSGRAGRQPAGEPRAEGPNVVRAAAYGYACITRRHEVTAWHERHTCFQQAVGGHVRLGTV